LILEVPEGSSSIYPHSEADSDVEEVEEGEGVADAAKTVAGNDEPIPESPKTPKLHPAALPPSQSPGRRSPVSPKSKLPSVGVSTGLLGWVCSPIPPCGLRRVKTTEFRHLETPHLPRP
jgi:hypothetical protein